MTDDLILWELQKITKELTKNKDEHTLNFRMMRPTERFHFNEPILNTSKLGLIRLPVYNSVFNKTERNNRFIYASTIPPGAYEIVDIADIIKQETNNNVLIQADKNTMKCKIEVIQDVISFDVDNSVGSLLGFDRQIYSTGIHIATKIVDIMGFDTINIDCNIISGVKDNGNDTDILYTFNLIEPPGYMIKIIPNNVLYQNVTKDRIEYIEFHIKDEYGRPIVFNGDVLSFTLHIV